MAKALEMQSGSLQATVRSLVNVNQITLLLFLSVFFSFAATCVYACVCLIADLCSARLYWIEGARCEPTNLPSR